MKKFKRIGALLAASTILFSGGVLAAEEANVLAKIKGEVLVNQGESYVTAQEGMQLNPGDQLMVMEGGLASIEFADGCLYKVNGNEALRIDTQSACAVNAAKAVGPYYTQLQPGQIPVNKEEENDKKGAIAFGTVAGAGLLYWLLKDDKETISP